MEQLHHNNHDQEVYESIRSTVDGARRRAAASVNYEMVMAYWEVGRQINEAIGERAEYGQHLLAFLSQRLTVEFGKGFTERNLRAMRQLNRLFPIRHTLCAELSWSHYRVLVRIEDEEKRTFYLNEAVRERWTVRQLERQIKISYYERLLKPNGPSRERLAARAQELDPPIEADELLKDPYVMDFIGQPDEGRHLEREIEETLATHIPKFLEELGHGYAFVGRQQRIDIDGRHYYVDFVFYNYIQKRFVLIDLKAGRITPEDVGKMDFYTRIFDATEREGAELPSIGLVLCAEEDDLVAKHSLLSDSDHLFASRYITGMPGMEAFTRALRAACDEDDPKT